MAIIKCPECGNNVSENAPICPNCGVKIAGSLEKCPQCDGYVLKGTESCPQCHHSIKPQVEAVAPPVSPAPSTPKSQEPKKGKTLIWIVVVAALLLLGSSAYYFINSQKKAASEEEAYAALENDINIADYQAFIDTYPDSKYAEDVKNRLNKLTQENNDWMEISLSGSKADFINFMNKYQHSPYEQACKNKIDSLDWAEIKSINTLEAYQRYLNEHPDGRYTDEAMDQKIQLDKLKITPEEQNMVKTVFTSYFAALSANDETAICSTLNAIMDNFLNKKEATKADVMAFMRKIHQADIISMLFTINNDYKITKTDIGNNDYVYDVTFTVDQKIERTDEGKETFATYMIVAKVTSQWKITVLNMRKVASSNE